MVSRPVHAPECQDGTLLLIPSGHSTNGHSVPDLATMVLIIAGAGVLHTRDNRRDVGPGALLWLPSGSASRLTAGAYGLACLSVDTARPLQ